MCGICGFVNIDPDRNLDQRVLKHMCQVIRHRGPDDEGYYLDKYAGLGMRRLSIIDLETGQQPITNEDQSLWIVFNGEIYNYKQLSAQLSKRGHRYVTRSDTEVILHAYEEYGDDCVNHLNGMFALAIWDVAQRRLFLARDHLGIKPLYYWATHDRLVFGSELKAIMTYPGIPRMIDPVALDQFLTLEYVPSPRTIFEDVKKLPAGHRLIFQEGNLQVEQFWDIPVKEIPDNELVCTEKLRELIADAVKLQMVSDVPLGAFLSGGIDSSTVVAFMSRVSKEPVRTFSIGFGDPTYNELPYARAVASQYQTNHYEEFLQPEISSLALKLVSHLDEPFGDFSIFPTYLVSEVARRHVKVVLSGDGGDELFGGYDTYVAQGYDHYYRWLPTIIRKRTLPILVEAIPPRPAKKGFVNKTKRFIEGASLPDSLQHTRWMMFLQEQEKSKLYSSEFQSSLNGTLTEILLLEYFQRRHGSDPLSQQQYVDIKTYLVDDILTKVDRMSMAVSLEARVPLLDYRIVEFAVNLPPKMKLHRGKTKRILRLAMADILPPIVLNKPKEGFSIPLKHWLRGPLQPMMMELLSKDGVKKRNYFNPETVDQWVKEHLENKANHSHRLWALMVFELWCRQMLDETQAIRA